MPPRVKTHLVIIDLPRQLCRGTGAPAVAGHIDQVPNMVTEDDTLESKATPTSSFKASKNPSKRSKISSRLYKIPLIWYHLGCNPIISF